MKAIFQFIILFQILTCHSSYSQNSYRDADGTRVFNSYRVTKNCVAYPVSLNKPSIVDSDNYIIIVKDETVRLNEKLENGDFIIEYNKRVKTEDIRLMSQKFDGDTLYYLVKRKDFESKFIKLYSNSLNYPFSLFPLKFGRYWFNGTTLNVGILALPFKLRPRSSINDFDFNGGLSLGTTLGIRHRVSRTEPYYLNIIGYTGLSSVPLNNKNTLSLAGTNTTRNEASFTYAVGIIYEMNNVQVGFILGRDLIANQSEVQWRDYNRNWLSIGLGTYLFNRRKDE